MRKTFLLAMALMCGVFAMAQNRVDGLKRIVVAGEEIKNFNPLMHDYKVYLPYTAGENPNISAECADPNDNYFVNGNTITVTGQGKAPITYRVNAETLPQLDMYLCIGQSNMAGRAPFTNATADMTGIYLLDGNGNFIPSPQRMSKYSNVACDEDDKYWVGPHYQFALDIHKGTQRPIGMVVNARGGSSVNQWVPSYTGGAPCYAKTLARVKQAKAYGTFKGILWHQGCNEAYGTYVMAAATYYQKINEMVAGLRTEMGNNDIWFIAGRLCETGQDASAHTKFNANVMNANIKTNVHNCDYVEATNLTLKSDNIHYDFPSACLMGSRYAQKIMDHVYGGDPFVHFHLNGGSWPQGSGAATQPDNQGLWTMFKADYINFYKQTPSDMTMLHCCDFTYLYGAQSILTSTASNSWKWLGDYIASVNTAQGKSVPSDEAGWRWNLHAFFNCKSGATESSSIEGAQLIAAANFTTAGQPSAWKSAWDASHQGGPQVPDSVITVTTTLPTPTKSGATFLGWYWKPDFSGNPVTTLNPGATGDLYAKWSTSGQTVAVTGVKLNKDSVELFPNVTAQLSATVLPSDATNKNVTWESTNTGIVTVSATGILTGVAIGNAKVIVTTADGNKKDTCIVTVKEQNLLAWELNGGTTKFPDGTEIHLQETVWDVWTIPTPYKEGCTFLGWYNNAQFSGSPVTELHIGDHGTFYAKWDCGDTPAGDCNPYGWKNADDMYKALAADVIAAKAAGMNFGFSQEFGTPGDEFGTPSANEEVGIAYDIQTFDIAFFTTEPYKTKWAWLYNYLEAQTTATAGVAPMSTSATDGGNSVWRWNMAAFFANSKRTSFPVTPDYSASGAASTQYLSTWGYTFCNGATDLEQMEQNRLEVKKFIENGQLYLQHEGIKYNAQGAIVK